MSADVTLAGTKAELAATKAELAENEAKLAATKAELGAVGAQLQEPDLSVGDRQELKEQQTHLRTTVRQLRTSVEGLREEEHQLRELARGLRNKLIVAAASPTSPTSPTRRKSTACWWPASWLESVTPLWHVRRGDDQSSRQQQQHSVPSSSSPPAQHLSTWHNAAVVLLVFITFVVGKQCSKEEAGCSWWLAGAERGASLLFMVIYIIGMSANRGAPQVMDLVAKWLWLQELSDAIDTSLQQRVAFLPAVVRRFMGSALVESTAAAASFAVHFVTLGVFVTVADVVLRVFWAWRG
ncbi:hypothetical protein HYH02_007677 [Chlamydomonas schloesseri]|uniref:Uncharacterized protein n=1 Tax=Chlamydomonas schloesseri TaxID=2026947 RepID=A0A835WHC4_9CHLO|nr:hypothetical protein HYH02_007677 [Chlamydomonas schloesseri]|eukprot:KAG2447348.1 hypothetical protein HYH02_007677 [Chlamydomonas schloesseri]